jgi:outer membrane putative beta-barrel porin/alpha-amylase
MHLDWGASKFVTKQWQVGLVGYIYQQISGDRGSGDRVGSFESSYGTNTIRDLIPYEFGGTVDLVLAPEGVRCRLELPSDWFGDDPQPYSETGAHHYAQLGHWA